MEVHIGEDLLNGGASGYVHIIRFLVTSDVGNSTAEGAMANHSSHHNSDLPFSFLRVYYSLGLSRCQEVNCYIFVNLAGRPARVDHLSTHHLANTGIKPQITSKA